MSLTGEHADARTLALVAAAATIGRRRAASLLAFHPAGSRLLPLLERPADLRAMLLDEGPRPATGAQPAGSAAQHYAARRAALGQARTRRTLASLPLPWRRLLTLDAERARLVCRSIGLHAAGLAMAHSTGAEARALATDLGDDARAVTALAGAASRWAAAETLVTACRSWCVRSLGRGPAGGGAGDAMAALGRSVLAGAFEQLPEASRRAAASASALPRMLASGPALLLTDEPSRRVVWGWVEESLADVAGGAA